MNNNIDVEVKDINKTQQFLTPFVFIGGISGYYFANQFVKTDNLLPKILYGYGTYFGTSTLLFTSTIKFYLMNCKRKLLMEQKLNNQNDNEKEKSSVVLDLKK